MTIYFTAELIDEYMKFRQLAACLPPHGGKPMPLTCKRCGGYHGGVANNSGVAFGHFIRGDNPWSQLTAVSTISERSIPLKCRCGCVTRWRKPR